MTVKDQLISATADLMRRRGVAGTAIAEILACSGVARRSIYLNFPGGKAELVTSATRASGEAITAALRGLIDSPKPVSGFITTWSTMLESSDFDAGCPVVAAALGRTEAPEAADVAGETFRDWRRLIADRLIVDGVSADDAGPLATTILAAVEGAVIQSQAQRSTAPLADVQEVLEELVARKVNSRGR